MVVFRSIISNFIGISRKMLKSDVNNDVRNEKLTIFTLTSPIYQILSLKNITKWVFMVVCRSIISNFIDILRKTTKKWGQ